jgi:hypothetical protein
MGRSKFDEDARAQASLLRCDARPSRSKPGSTFCDCKPNSLDATLNQDSG